MKEMGAHYRRQGVRNERGWLKGDGGCRRLPGLEGFMGDILAEAYAYAFLDELTSGSLWLYLPCDWRACPETLVKPALPSPHLGSIGPSSASSGP